MNNLKTIKLLFLGILTFAIVSCTAPTEEKAEQEEAVVQKVDKQSFVGRWALNLPGGAGWLEVMDKGEYFDGDLLWYGGSVVPVSMVVFSDNAMKVTSSREVVRERDEDDNPTRVQTMTTWRTFSLVNEDEMEGRAYIPQNGLEIEVVHFTAKRLPALPAAPDLSAMQLADPIELLSTQDLTGWKLTNEESVSGWTMKDGILTNDPVQEEGKPHVHYGNLRTEKEFEDFKLSLEVNIPEGSNSGIYLRGIYEVQVVDSYGKPLDSHNMGGLYSRITPSEAAEKPAGEWQNVDITLFNHHLTVVLNGTTIIDNQPVQGVTGGALTADEFSPGPIYLQGDHGKVSYRNIVLTPIVE
jgi:hypothetical protein